MTQGSVPPGASVSLTCLFSAPPHSLAQHTQGVRIHVTGHDYVSDPNGESLVYTLVGESVTPSINTGDWEGIFEEQCVVTDSLELERVRETALAGAMLGEREGGGEENYPEGLSATLTSFTSTSAAASPHTTTSPDMRGSSSLYDPPRSRSRSRSPSSPHRLGSRRGR